MREIGSEFWRQYEAINAADTNSVKYLLSGRTALKFIIEDICKTRLVKKALLPSYCCESMIQPFVASGIAVEFYQVSCDNIDYPYDNDADIVFLIDFFGYVIDKNASIAKFEKQAGKIIIYDATHKLNGNPDIEIYADYSFCSYRKWFYCNYAKAVKHSGKFVNKIELTKNSKYIKLRDKSADAKKKYIEGLAADKEEFLCWFNTAEQMLDEDYEGYAGTPVDFDLNEIVKKRRENASYLINELKKIPEIKLWRDKIKNQDTPLFVPILVDLSIRSDLRSKLIKESIYCPVHWPKTSYHGYCNEVYDMELSLICDQRYDIADMERMIKVIKDYFNR